MKVLFLDEAALPSCVRARMRAWLSVTWGGERSSAGTGQYDGRGGVPKDFGCSLYGRRCAKGRCRSQWHRGSSRLDRGPPLAFVRRLFCYTFTGTAVKTNTFGDFKQLPPATGKAPFIVLPRVHEFQCRVLRQNRPPSLFCPTSAPPLKTIPKPACGARPGAKPGDRELPSRLDRHLVLRVYGACS